MGKFWDTIVAFFQSSGVAAFFTQGLWLNIIMIVVACVLLFLAIKKDFEPYLLLPIAFGMLLINLPLVGQEIFQKGATVYDPSMLAGNVAGVDLETAKDIFSLIGKQTATTTELHNLVISKTFVSDMLALGHGYEESALNEIASNIDHIYSLDYNGIFGFLYY